MSSATACSGRPSPSGKRRRVHEHDEAENKDTVSVDILKEENRLLTNENGELKQRLDEEKAKNINLRASWDSTKQDAESLRSQLREAEMEKKKYHDALLKESSKQQDPMLQLAKSLNCQIMIPIESHAQVMTDILPLFVSGN
ncbi:hypothetical protein FGADI_3889 [Fusarium gaditjirri]|uniref:Uncharacterized protein n=1 Tax=Fusarium gaditjirri TaxID=282569 RepID=A0A8H4WZJ7_9HYPO|nr:hypothetical protein FGADI_3889 [Fusarium gaditjirri]